MLLIVDDDPVHRGSTAALLSARGFMVDTASSVDEGLRKVKELKPRVVVLDLVMPGNGGEKFLRELQKLPEFVAVRKIVVTTALPDPLPWLPNEVAILRKPFEIEELLNLALLGGRE